MRRKLAAAFLAAGLFAAAGCGGDGGGGGASTEDVCNDINQTVDPLDAELNASLQQAGMAAAQGDDAALAEATLELDRLVDEVTTAVRDGAEDAEDAEFGQALNDFADELETMITTAVTTGEAPDTTSFEEASDRVGGYCDA